MIATTRSLQCDFCGRLEDFGLMQPATSVELRREAKTAGWRRAGHADDARASIIDECPACQEKP